MMMTSSTCSMEEIETLVVDPSIPSKNQSNVEEAKNYPTVHLYVAPTRVGRFLVMMSIASLIVGLAMTHLCEKEENVQRLIGKKSKSNSDDEVTFYCPNDIKKSDNDKDALLTEFYEQHNHKSNSSYSKMEEIDINKLKNSGHDGWGATYYDTKKILYRWKSEQFSSLKSGDKIFESGCGIGLNLLLTVEILKESANVENLQVYGIDYVPSSVRDANYILNQLLPQTGNASLGSTICRGDATDLDFIPSNTFDLAYSGYIDPIQDPLNLKEKLGREIKWNDLCNDVKNPTKNGKLDQSAVEDWFAAWVSELVRIAKPGKPIIVEKVSLPKCVDKMDWGGVNKSWWTEAVTKYEWDVDEKSILIKDLYPHGKGKGRYNVYMEKTKIN